MPIGEAIRGTHIREDLKRFEKSQWMTPDGVEKLQLEKLQSLLVHAYEHVPYYHNMFDQLGFQPSQVQSAADIACLPLLTKKIIRKNMPDMMAREFPSAELVKGASSGSTGEPLQYFYSKRSASMRAAAVRRFWKWTGYELGEKWLRVQLWPRSKFALGARINRMLSRCTYIGSYQFDDMVIAESVREIDIARAEAARERAEKYLAEGPPPDTDAYLRMEAALRRSKLRIDAARRYRGTARRSEISPMLEDKG